MTPLQTSALWYCWLPNGLPIEGSTRPRQIRWLLDRGLIRKIGGRWKATRSGRLILFHQIEDWPTVSAEAKQQLAASLKRG